MEILEGIIVDDSAPFNINTDEIYVLEDEPKLSSLLELGEFFTTVMILGIKDEATLLRYNADTLIAIVEIDHINHDGQHTHNVRFGTIFPWTTAMGESGVSDIASRAADEMIDRVLS